MCTHQKQLSGALLMSVYNICFYGEITKISKRLVEEK